MGSGRVPRRTMLSTSARRLREVESNQQAREMTAVGIGDEDAAEARRIEHRGDPNEPGSDLDPSGLRVRAPGSRCASRHAGAWAG